jgi:hypothetical protein
MELLPRELPSEPVPSERVALVNVYHCDGSSGATTFGANVTDGTLLGVIVARARIMAIGMKAEPFGGVISCSADCATDKYSSTKQFQLHTQSSLGRPWSVDRPCLLSIPAVPQVSHTLRSSDSPKTVRLVVIMWRARDAVSKPEDFCLPPIILNADRFATGGKAASAAVQQCVLEAMHPFLKAGRQGRSLVLTTLLRCTCGSVYPEGFLGGQFSCITPHHEAEQ